MNALNQRRFSRVPFDASTTLLVDGVTHEANLLDISLKGALVEAPPSCNLMHQQQVDLEISLTGSDIKIRMTGEVTHIEADRIGMRSVSIDMESIGHLRRLMELNTGDTMLVERELSALL